jgi:REP element-mobilizing transposase RayT
MRGVYLKLYVHLVWSTWDRLPLITPELAGPIYRCFLSECSGQGVEMLAAGGMPDHVHVLVKIPSTVTIAVLVKQLKGVSSHLVSHVLAPGSYFRWQGSYAAFSVSRWDVAKIRGYIRRQKQHHATPTRRRLLHEPPSGVAVPSAKADIV